MKIPGLSKSPGRSADIKQKNEALEQQRNQLQRDVVALKEKRAGLPFGTSTDTLEKINAELRAKEDMITALREQLDKGGVLYREAMMAEYQVAGPRQCEIIRKKVEAAHAAAKEFARALSELRAAEAGLKEQIRPFSHLPGRRFMNPIQKAREMLFDEFAQHKGPHGRDAGQRNIALNDFAQHSHVTVGLDYGSSIIAELFERAAGLTIDQLTSEAK